MCSKPMHTAWHAQATEGFLPGNSIRLFARLGGQSVRAFSPTDEPIDFLLNVNEGLFHGC